MTNAVADSVYDEALPPVPEFEIDRNGNRIDLSGPIWLVVDPSSHLRGIHWEKLPDGEIKHALQLYIAHSLRSDATVTCHDKAKVISRAMHHGEPPASLFGMNLCWWNGIRQWYREKDQEEKIHYLRDWYLWMTDHGFPGVDLDVAIAIDDWSVRRRQGGGFVTTLDREKGPLSERQFAALELVLNKVQPATLGQAATIICKELGVRPRAVTLLQERDLHTFADPGNPSAVTFQLDVPRVKKGQIERDTKRRPLSSRAGAVLANLIAANRQRFGAVDAHRPLLCREEPQQLPMAILGAYRDAYRCNDNDIRKMVYNYGESHLLGIFGSNTAFSIHPRRLRYTFGCRLASLGATADTIAEALDHEDRQNVGVYVEMRGDMAGRLSDALDSRMAPLIDKFMGRSLQRELFREGDATQIPGRNFQGQSLGCIGVCASPMGCKLRPPLTCYSCSHYDPFNDADTPHEKMLEVASQLRNCYLARENAGEGGLEKVEEVILNIQACIEVKRRLAEVGGSGRRSDPRNSTIDLDVSGIGDQKPAR